MQVTRINKMRIVDPDTGFWAEFDWTDSKLWHCKPGQASEGFFEKYPNIRRVQSESEMLLMMLKYTGE